MKQILNIITKDVRHHWFEVAASMALMVAFAGIEIHGWTHQDAMAVGFSGFFVYRILLQLVVVLVPLSWMFLIVRVVQGESLVGDRQFWVTRPYDWKKLVAAKALFVLAFINLPLFVLDVFLLAKGGFRPSSHVPGLFWMQLLLILALFLPTAALAVITAGLGQMLLALLIVVLYMIGMAVLSNLVPNSDYSGGNDSWLGIVLIGTALAVILLQYSTRRTARSRWLIVGLAAALTLLLIATPYRSLMARDYPLPDTSSLKFALLPGHPPDPGDIAYDRDPVPIHLPLELTGLANDSFLQMNGFIITVTNSRGERWDSGWHVRSMLLFSDQKSHSSTSTSRGLCSIG
jgi:hypothetical protein